MTPANPADVEKALATAPVQRAIRTWGPVQGEAMHVSGGGRTVLALAHPQRGILTFVDNSPGALRGGNPVALSLGHAPTAEHGLRYYTVSGAPVTDLAVSGGHVTVTAVQPSPGEVDPDFNMKTFIFCFTACVAEKNIQPACLQNCATCGRDLVSGAIMASLVPCGACAACAGRHGISCAKQCAG